MALFLFKSTHAVINAEKLLRSKKIQFKVIPVPRAISSQCGMAIESGDKDKQKIFNILAKKQIIFQVYNQ